MKKRRERVCITACNLAHREKEQRESFSNEEYVVDDEGEVHQNNRIKRNNDV